MYKPWNIWVTIAVQIYDNTIYIKYKFEGEDAVVLSGAFTRTNTVTNIQYDLGR